MDGKTKSPAGVLGIVGGALLVIGSILPWAKVSVDVERLASVLGVDPSLIAGSTPTSQSIGGLDADGAITIVAGIVVLVCAGLYLVKRANTALGIVILLGGLAGAGIALYDLASKDRQIDTALADAGPSLEAVGLTADTFKEVFTISFSIGIYLCLVGGVIALIAGAMALMAKPAPMGDVAVAPAAGGTGFGTTPASPPPPAGSMPPASEPMPPSPPSGEPPSSTP